MIFPGATIGILGGGQLGRMFAIAARQMGYRVHALDPQSDCPAGQVADLEVTAAYDDLEAARAFAREVDVVTFEFENVPSETLAAIEAIAPVHPSPRVLEICRHRLREKEFLREAGIPIAPFRKIDSLESLRDALAQLGTPAILKTADFGYDGKGQTRIDAPDQADSAWHNLGRPVGVLEGFVAFDREISVVIARTSAGEVGVYDVFENLHRHHILHQTLCPARISTELAQQAQQLASQIAQRLELVGVLCVEMFVRGSDIIVNELAPRPHNSGHLTIDACITSQFEQQVRAVCGLPLGDCTRLSPAAMVNLLGDLWIDGPPPWERCLASPHIKLHLYGKHTPRPGRKMGHLTALMPTAPDAVAQANLAYERLTAKSSPRPV